MKLPVLSVVKAGFSEAGHHWQALLKALIIPAIAMAWMRVAINRTPQEYGWMLTALVIGVPAGVLFAVACHRIVLLGEDSLFNRWGLYWTAREMRFIGWSILVGLLLFLVLMLTFPIVWAVVELAAAADMPIEWLGEGAAEVLGWAIYAPTAYLMSRICLVLPATAVDQRPRLGDAWRLSRGNGWRLAIALAVPGLLLGGFAYILGLIVDAPDNIALLIAVATLYGLLGAVGVTVISVAFRTLSSDEQATDSASRSGRRKSRRVRRSRSG